MSGSVFLQPDEPEHHRLEPGDIWIDRDLIWNGTGWDPITRADPPPPMALIDGRWVEAAVIPMQGVVARTEEWLRKRGFTRIPNLLARFDERNLGK